ncbi:branched-chain amino acid aminotransferase [Pontivivens ytuae]|uniref:branched-chain amino acid aminotransferase n=1 Tax=Pontivivens ytuae TaxID=2789856 RepID=UPI001E2A8861|nr:branched-chain amino acid aminotransferase [Pontivivens ytuae]
MALGTQIRTWFKGRWHEGNPAILGAADHATWLGTLVFDGARTFEGVSPDLDLHCARVVRSARAMGMEPPVEADEIERIAREGIAMYPDDAELYIRPMMWSAEGAANLIAPDPGSCVFALTIEDFPVPPLGAISLTVSPFRRPRPDMALTEAKAACLYPNNGRMLTEAKSRGFDNALSLDFEDNVAETATTNAFLVKDGVVRTPVPNGTFLDGITRQRVIALLREDGTEVEEASLRVEDFAAADEIFLTGNAAKVMGVKRFEEREMQLGPVTRRARELYWSYAHGA